MVFFTQLIALVTAIIKIVQTIMDWVSDRAKKKPTSTPLPTATPTLIPANISTSSLRLWVRVIVLLLTSLSIFYLMFVHADKVATRGDIAWIGLLVALYVVTSLDRS
jgi:hypothetical protein